MHRKKELQQISLSSDVRKELKQQADAAGLTVSMYIERMVLEKKIKEDTIAELKQKGEL